MGLQATTTSLAHTDPILQGETKYPLWKGNIHKQYGLLHTGIWPVNVIEAEMQTSPQPY